MWLRRASMAVLSLGVLAASAGASWHPDPSWELKDTGVQARLRGLDVVTSKVVWASGSEGTVIRTTDGGRSWQQRRPARTRPTCSSATSRRSTRRRAVILSIGTGEDSRIYRTADGGAHLDRDVPQHRPERVLRLHGLLRRPPRAGPLRPGRRQVPHRSRPTTAAGAGGSCRTTGMPAALAGEFAFAASGTCLVGRRPGGPGSRPAAAPPPGCSAPTTGAARGG